jgi:hypothetical protein
MEFDADLYDFNFALRSKRIKQLLFGISGQSDPMSLELQEKFEYSLYFVCYAFYL